jgi:hypothetical protein
MYFIVINYPTDHENRSQVEPQASAVFRMIEIVSIQKRQGLVGRVAHPPTSFWQRIRMAAKKGITSTGVP